MHAYIATVHKRKLHQTKAEWPYVKFRHGHMKNGKFKSLAEHRHIHSQHYRKPQSANFDCDHMEPDKINNLLIDTDRLIDNLQGSESICVICPTLLFQSASNFKQNFVPPHILTSPGDQIVFHSIP